MLIYPYTAEAKKKKAEEEARKEAERKKVQQAAEKARAEEERKKRAAAEEANEALRRELEALKVNLAEQKRLQFDSVVSAYHGVRAERKKSFSGPILTA
eukprot:g36403.t1